MRNLQEKMANRARRLLETVPWTKSELQNQMYQAEKILSEARLWDRAAPKDPKDWIREVFEQNGRIGAQGDVTPRQLLGAESLVDLAHLVTPHIGTD